MTDHFDEKHKMIQKLLGMLKSHAVGEVEGGLKHPEGEGDMHGIQAERVEVADHDMDHPTPEHDVVTHELSKGGVVEKVNATDPTPNIHSGPIPYESAEGHPDKEGSAHEEATESEAEREAEGDVEPVSEPTSMFASLFAKKKKK